MPGKLEPVRRLLAKRRFRPLRDAFVNFAWRLDPDLSALGWVVLDVALSENRRREFFSWTKYDLHYRWLQVQLRADPEWRFGPAKSWDVARGALQSLQYLSDLASCRALDFGCGTHFSDSTAMVLYLCGIQTIDCLEISQPVSGFQNGAALDLIHWIKDQLITGNFPTLPNQLSLNLARLDELHKHAVSPKENTLTDIRLIQGDIFKQEWTTGRYDLITSNAVLEHVQDPKAILERLKDVLRVGGIMHHVVDFRDHRWYYHPASFNPLPAVPSISHWSDPGTNGWRYSDWLSLVKADSNLEFIVNQPRLLDGSIAQSTNGMNIASCEFIIRRLG